MNSMIQQMLRKAEEEARKQVVPNPSEVKSKKSNKDMEEEEECTFEYIISKKPSSKKVLKYIKKFINEIYEESDSD